MPNKHDSSKVQTGFWTDKELKEKVQAILKKRGATLTDEIIALMEKIAREENEKESNCKKSK
jgi:hypothetical protein